MPTNTSRPDTPHPSTPPNFRPQVYNRYSSTNAQVLLHRRKPLPPLPPLPIIPLISITCPSPTNSTTDTTNPSPSPPPRAPTPPLSTTLSTPPNPPSLCEFKYYLPHISTLTHDFYTDSSFLAYGHPIIEPNETAETEALLFGTSTWPWIEAGGFTHEGHSDSVEGVCGSSDGEADGVKDIGKDGVVVEEEGKVSKDAKGGKEGAKSAEKKAKRTKKNKQKKKMPKKAKGEESVWFDDDVLGKFGKLKIRQRKKPYGTSSLEEGSLES
ncbi:hypothetical protein M011DRAFT_466344 [Sporormia fimetaria CBS 119925]|uniref:Uncharacterized protein n=1 Tax=Sporormia fimetaria CBS 119925 TaxID=1340428 RepID=A0A6A6VHE0_9PLEO|nr:hypothetical protein M011DRAFT_466344 [Sporormia fimetaria CBS 119925]